MCSKAPQKWLQPPQKSAAAPSKLTTAPPKKCCSPPTLCSTAPWKVTTAPKKVLQPPNFVVQTPKSRTDSGYHSSVYKANRWTQTITWHRTSHYQSREEEWRRSSSSLVQCGTSLWANKSQAAFAGAQTRMYDPRSLFFTCNKLNVNTLCTATNRSVYSHTQPGTWWLTKQTFAPPSNHPPRLTNSWIHPVPAASRSYAADKNILCLFLWLPACIKSVNHLPCNPNTFMSFVTLTLHQVSSKHLLLHHTNSPIC